MKMSLQPYGLPTYSLGLLVWFSGKGSLLIGLLRGGLVRFNCLICALKSHSAQRGGEGGGGRGPLAQGEGREERVQGSLSCSELVHYCTVHYRSP